MSGEKPRTFTVEIYDERSGESLTTTVTHECDDTEAREILNGDFGDAFIDVVFGGLSIMPQSCDEDEDEDDA